MAVFYSKPLVVVPQELMRKGYIIVYIRRGTTAHGIIDNIFRGSWDSHGKRHAVLFGTRMLAETEESDTRDCPHTVDCIRMAVNAVRKAEARYEAMRKAQNGEAQVAPEPEQQAPREWEKPFVRQKKPRQAAPSKNVNVYGGPRQSDVYGGRSMPRRTL